MVPGGLSPHLADRIASHSSAGSLHRGFAGVRWFSPALVQSTCCPALGCQKHTMNRSHKGLRSHADVGRTGSPGVRQARASKLVFKGHQTTKAAAAAQRNAIVTQAVFGCFEDDLPSNSLSRRSCRPPKVCQPCFLWHQCCPGPDIDNSLLGLQGKNNRRGCINQASSLQAVDYTVSVPATSLDRDSCSMACLP